MAMGKGRIIWSFTINPAKIPAGAQFVISAVSPGHVRGNHQVQAEWEMVPASAPVTCKLPASQTFTS
jgi:hypothetical protein